MSGKRLIELDSLRGIAALAVVFYHYTSRFGEKFHSSVITNKISFTYGHFGVELFFIISGFVIFMTVNQNMKPLSFISKRVIRLFPVFWISMLFTTLMVMLFDIDELKVNSYEFIVNIFMIPSLFDIKAVDGVYWTLKVEWFFYFSIFFLLLIKKLDKISSISLFLVILIIILTIFYKLHPYFYYALLFICGINFHLIWKKDEKVINHLMVFSLLIVSAISKNLELFTVSIILIGTMYLLVYDKLKFLEQSSLVFFGRISYALYLIHQNFGHSLQIRLIEFGFESIFVLILLPFVLSILFSWLITYYFEVPLARKLRNYLSINH